MKKAHTNNAWAFFKELSVVIEKFNHLLAGHHRLYDRDRLLVF